MRFTEFNLTPAQRAIREHIKRGVPFSECMFRPGSEAFTEFYTRVREMRENLDLDWQDAELLDTNIGECIMVEGERVPLDVPIEEAVDIDEMAKRVPDEPGAYTMKQGKTEYKLTSRLNRNDRPSGEWQIYVKDRGNWEWDRTVGSKRDAINWIKTQKEEVELDEVTVANAAKAFDIKKQAVALKAKIAKLKNTPGDAAHMKMIDAKRSFDKKIAALQALDVDAYEIKKLKESSLDEAETDKNKARTRKYFKGFVPLDTAPAFDPTAFDSIPGEGDPEDPNVQYQLRKSVTMKGNKDVKFANGEEIKVKEPIARAVLAKIDSLRTSNEKFKVVNYIEKSYENLINFLNNDMQVTEAEYQGRKVKLNSPKRGGSKKFYVYTKNDKGNVIKVAFGAKDGGGNLAVKLKDPKARRAFADRHNCEKKNDKTKPGYWACRLPRYAKSLGLSGGGTWW